MKKILTILILSLTLAGAGCSFFAQNQPEQEEITQEPVEIKEEVDISDWQTYTNDEYGFSFRYPKDWHIIIKNSLSVNLLSEKTFKQYEGEEILSADVYINNVSGSVEEKITNMYEKKQNYELIQDTDVVIVSYDEYNDFTQSFNKYFYIQNLRENITLEIIFFKENILRDVINDIIKSIAFN